MIYNSFSGKYHVSPYRKMRMKSNNEYQLRKSLLCSSHYPWHEKHVQRIKVAKAMRFNDPYFRYDPFPKKIAMMKRRWDILRYNRKNPHDPINLRRVRR